MKKTWPSVEIVICTYNNEDIIESCLKTVQNIDYTTKSIIVIDDCSIDKTVEIIKKQFPAVKLIEKQQQSGPAKSRNLAIEQSKAYFILFMDSDVIPKKDFLKKIVQSAALRKNTPIMGGKLLLPDGKIDSAGGGLSKIGVGFDIGHNKNKDAFNQSKEVLYVPSAAMLVNRRLFDMIGYFDETYFYGHEDTDLCWRARIKGFKVYYCHKAVAYHYKNKTIKTMMRKVHYHGVRNRIRSLIKNHQLKNLLVYLTAYKLYSIFDIIKGPYRKEKIVAWWWNVRNISHTLKERKKVQKTRQIKDKELPFSRMGI